MTATKSKCALGIASDLTLSSHRLSAQHHFPSRFRIVDTYQGVVSDPISLHKYLYGGGNPVNMFDPSGHYSLVEGLVATAGYVKLIAIVLVGVSAGNDLFQAFSQHHYGSGVGKAGGKDITQSLIKIRQHFVAQWNGLGSTEQDRLLDATTRPPAVLYAWDIQKLMNPQNENELQAGTDHDLHRTVTVAGRVFWSDEVNYYLWGLITRLKDEKNKSGSTLQASEESVNVATLKVGAYRTAFWGGTNISGRQAWVRAGYYDDFSKANGAAIAGAIPNSAPFTMGLWARLGPHPDGPDDFHAFDLP